MRHPRPLHHVWVANPKPTYWKNHKNNKKKEKKRRCTNLTVQNIISYYAVISFMIHFKG